jgi:hypothetical protein
MQIPCCGGTSTTVERYDEHFWRNGHAAPIIVFDDSSPANQEKYYPLLEQTCTHNSFYYVGPLKRSNFSPTSTNVHATSGWWD